MRRAILFASVVFLFAAAAGPSAQAPSPQAQQNPPKSSQPPQSAAALKSRTRLITVDVVVTDSHGKPIRGLKQDDFQVSEEHSGPQKIVKFRVVETSSSVAAPAGAAKPSGAGVYSNQAIERLTVPPSILLMDALNTEIDQQAEVHRHMLMLLKTLPTTTPIAVFVLGRTLHVVQGFTTNPALLRAAVDKALRPPDLEQNPQDDPNTQSYADLEMNGDQETPSIQALEDFEKQTFEAQMGLRVEETTGAMISIARYLGGYPGRKDLLWFSAAFPSWIAPTSDFGSQSFQGTASYEEKIRKAFESLADAQVAVYPVDARGLESSQLYSATQNPRINRNNPGAGFAGQITREDTARINAQDTMEQVAQETGGKICENTNELSGCVQSALDDSSVYYELAYYPENVKWDGGFHKITVKSNQHGTHLRYRTGYFATDPAALAARQTPERLLQEACMGPLPATSIALTATALAPKQAQGQAQAPGARYLLTIPTGALSWSAPGASRELHLQMAICEYAPKDDTFAFYPRDLSRSISDAEYQDWQVNGVRSIFNFDAKPDTQRLRFAVIDVPSGDAGSVDVPAHPDKFGPTPGQAVSEAPGAAPPAADAPAAPREVYTSFTFKGSLGNSSKLDWKSGTITYTGDLGIDFGAAAFFQTTVGAQFHCQGGNLVPNDPSSTAPPKLIVVFETPQGSAALVDFTGSEPQYSGSLRVDPGALPFFNQVWKLCHCQQP